MLPQKHLGLWIAVCAFAAVTYVFSPAIAALGNGLYKERSFVVGARKFLVPRGWIVLDHPDYAELAKYPISVFDSLPRPFMGFYSLGRNASYDWKHGAAVSFSKEGADSSGTVEVLNGTTQCLTGFKTPWIHIYCWDEQAHIVAEYSGKPGSKGSFLEMLSQLGL